MTNPAPNDRTALARPGVTALAVLCCAGGPLLVAVAGSLAAEAPIGFGAAVLLLVACAALYVRHRPGTKRPRSRP